MAKVLVVDDDAATREVMRLTLERVGHTVVEAPDGVRGLDRFQSHEPALVVTNVFMPEREGLELIRMIRCSSQVPILVVSGGSSSMLDVFAVARAFGASLDVQKPFEPDELVDAVRRLLDPVSQ